MSSRPPLPAVKPPRPHEGATPLWIKAAAPFIWLGMIGMIFGVFMLVLKGASWGLNSWEYSRLGPLQQAAWDGDAARCERLVKGGQSVDATDGEDYTALGWAVYYCHTDVVRKLVELGADVNHVDNRRFTPLMYTAVPLRGVLLNGTQEQRNEIAKLLIQHGADVNHAMGDGQMGGSGQTTLHFAAADKNAELVRILLDAGADRNAKEIPEGWTPLDVAKFPDHAPNDAVIAELERPRDDRPSRSLKP